jgi:hypothetical protein
MGVFEIKDPVNDTAKAANKAQVAFLKTGSPLLYFFKVSDISMVYSAIVDYILSIGLEG